MPKGNNIVTFTGIGGTYSFNQPIRIHSFLISPISIATIQYGARITYNSSSNPSYPSDLLANPFSVNAMANCIDVNFGGNPAVFTFVSPVFYPVDLREVISLNIEGGEINVVMEYSLEVL